MSTQLADRDTDDRDLARRAGRGDRQAFEALVERYQGLIFGYLRARILTPSDAEDLTQEVFLRCYVGRARFDDSLLVRPWLLGVARNVLREFLRKQRRSKVVAWTELCLEADPSTLPDATACSLEDDRIDQLPKCLDHLSGKAREAIEMHYGGRLRLAEIGDRIKRSEGAVKLLMYRARQALKRCLNGQPTGESGGEE